MPLAELGEYIKQVIAREQKSSLYLQKILQTKLIKVDLCQYKKMTSTPYPVLQNYIFKKTKKLLHIKEYKELLKPILIAYHHFTKISENKIWVEDLQYNSLQKWFNRLQDVIIKARRNWSQTHSLKSKEYYKHLKNVNFPNQLVVIPL